MYLNMWARMEYGFVWLKEESCWQNDRSGLKIKKDDVGRWILRDRRGAKLSIGRPLRATFKFAAQVIRERRRK